MNSKLYRTSFIALLIPILIVGCGKKTEQTAVEKTTAPSADVKKMMDEYDDLNKACKTGNFASACEQQVLVGNEITSKGWCFGEEGQNEADKKWHECNTRVAQKSENISALGDDKKRFCMLKAKPLCAYKVGEYTGNACIDVITDAQCLDFFVDKGLLNIKKNNFSVAEANQMLDTFMKYGLVSSSERETASLLIENNLCHLSTTSQENFDRYLARAKEASKVAHTVTLTTNNCMNEPLEK